VFDGLTEADAVKFAAGWLPAWTGNDPERLAAFYTDDVFYSDPAIPMEGGFLNHWHASIPVGGNTVECDGVCTVRLRDGLIERNQVFFDRAELLTAITEVELGAE
jgi:hypothetical protein